MLFQFHKKPYSLCFVNSKIANGKKKKTLHMMDHFNIVEIFNPKQTSADVLQLFLENEGMHETKFLYLLWKLKSISPFPGGKHPDHLH